jgi:hypothetical protein
MSSGESIVERVGLRLEAPSSAAGLEEEARHRPMTGEDLEHRAKRNLGFLAIGSDSAATVLSTFPDELVRGRPHEFAKDRFLGGEVEVDAALGDLGGGRDVVDRGVAVPAFCERLESPVEDRLAAGAAVVRGLRALAAHHLSPAQVGIVKPTDRPTDQSVANTHASAARRVASEAPGL